MTINDDKAITGGDFGITLKHTADVTIENSTISGLNTTTGRVGSAIDDSYGDSTGMVVQDNNISDFKSAVQLTTRLVTGNYIHDPGYIAGDHTNGVIANGGTGQLTISDNTILNSLSETDAVTIDTSTVPGPVSNKTIDNNLLGGGDYAIYGGTAFGHATSNIVTRTTDSARPTIRRVASSAWSPISTPRAWTMSGPATSGTAPGKPSRPRSPPRSQPCARRPRAADADVRVTPGGRRADSSDPPLPCITHGSLPMT